MALEVGDDGLPAYREVVISVPRQAGKSVLLFAWMVWRCLSATDAVRIAYTAQTGWDARRKLLEDFEPHLRRSVVQRAVQRIYRSNAETAIVWRDGSRIEIVASVEDAGHGRVLDGAVIDEAWADADDRREAALIPTMVTRPAAQLWIASSAGTEASVYWHRKVELGRAAVAEPSGICYFEWSAPGDVDTDDEDVWWATHPALGATIGIDAVRHARRTMTEPEFRRAMLNIPTSAQADRVVPAAAWDAICSLRVAPSGRLRLAADAMPDRSRAAIVAFGDGVAELVEAREGVTWLPQRLAELARRHRAQVLIDGRGPLGGLAHDLRALGVRVRELRTDEVIAASARALDAICDRKVRVRSSPALDAAAAAVRKRPVGDRWLWSRQSSDVDVSPFVALALAVGATEDERAPLVAVT